MGLPKLQRKPPQRLELFASTEKFSLSLRINITEETCISEKVSKERKYLSV